MSYSESIGSNYDKRLIKVVLLFLQANYSQYDNIVIFGVPDLVSLYRFSYKQIDSNTMTVNVQYKWISGLVVCPMIANPDLVLSSGYLYFHSLLDKT